MRWVNTKRWLIKPKTGYTFRVENEIYYCHLSIWHFALIRKTELML